MQKKPTKSTFFNKSKIIPLACECSTVIPTMNGKVYQLSFNKNNGKITYWEIATYLHFVAS